jgi:hypothetical protein
LYKYTRVCIGNKINIIEIESIRSPEKIQKPEKTRETSKIRNFLGNPEDLATLLRILEYQ